MTTIAFVVGEPSGDRIGADLMRALRVRTGEDIAFVGLGGEAMQAEGLDSLFDIHELSIIGIGAIVARLPQLVRRLLQTSDFIVKARPDALVIIDSPTFSHRVARRVRARLPELPIANYIPPTIWAWRENRAGKMRAYVDHAICALPFEPATMQEFGGPPATYVGHPLMSDPALERIIERVEAPGADRRAKQPPTLLLLPGSRRGEIVRLIDDFGETLQRLGRRVPGLKSVLPTLERHAPMVREKVSRWEIQPRVVTGEDAKWAAFASADAALAASGTVSLELALADIPMALTYRLDPVGYRFRHLITAWTAALPNFIAGHPLVPEHFHEIIRPELLARRLERLLTETPERHAQLAGFAQIRDRMAIDRAPGDSAAAIVLDLISRRT
ncbi:MAG: lipid-A-disaccharide synthase [Aurantimonas endophytica]|uniref:Lipid-A-disaccharide synthase n=1 Tax=Aurantimonas endophytica TaxID=1522175 RepID=A0A7W6HAD3_9HYPH|nr:lipid-A-disaccharide synthase [Aurantimonas endophytica]MBB4001482.1 lipid-A-disaccharide synthase [Aurantimonas endophytica]MCO6402877.1 lipid-A-disaccharide synthase [Aurantimonas endophytica]